MKQEFKNEFKKAYDKAIETLTDVGYQNGKMVSIPRVIETVEKKMNIDIKFREFDFGKLDRPNDVGTFSRYGAAMYVSPEGPNREARILLNSRETPEMQRFSLMHEIGHLLLDNMKRIDDGYLFSTHIDMDITTISDEDIQDDFSLGEQMANIFALALLVPYDALLDALKKNDSLDAIAGIFGVEKKAVISRMTLGLALGG